MTDTPESTTPDMEPGSPRAARRWGLAAGLAVLVVVLIGFAVSAAARADNNDHMRDGQMMGGSTMWNSPQAMRDWCVQATGDGRAGVDDATRWCDLMVDWMNARRGDPRD